MTTQTLDNDLRSAINQLRGNLVDLLGSVPTDPLRPQEMSRQLGIDKSLAWKVSRLIRAIEPSEALQHLPGEAAFDIFLNAASKAGAASQRIRETRSLLASFWKIVEQRIGDRPTLELVLDAMPASASKRLALSRKLAFRGNSGIWGVQARARLNLSVLAPNADDPDWVDCALVGGWLDFRRLRSDARWVLFRRSAYRTGDEPPKEEPLLDIHDATMRLPDFCAGTIPPVRTYDERGKTLYEIGEGPVGNSGAFDFCFGSLTRRLGQRFATQKDQTGDMNAMISAPVEVLVFDLLVHRDLPFATRPRARVFGSLGGMPTERDLIPLEIPLHQLGSPPVLATPIWSKYASLVQFVLDRCGWNPADFVGIRCQIEYPPFPSSVVLSFPLPHRDA